MDDKQKLDRIKQFIKAHQLAVISTVNKDAKPESAVIGFALTEDFNLIFGTFSTSRKYINLQSNSSIAVVIGWDQGKTVQLEGTVSEVTEPREIDVSITSHLSKIPNVAKFLERPDERLFKIKPTWVSYSDLSVDPWDITEVRF